jgi:hypothetical protein
MQVIAMEHKHTHTEMGKTSSHNTRRKDIKLRLEILIREKKKH